MARQRRSVLARTSSEITHMNGASEHLPTMLSGHGLTRDEQRTLDEYRKQRLAMEATVAKFKLAETRIAELHNHGAQLYAEATDAIEEAKEGSRDSEAQTYLDEFSNRSKRALGSHLMAAQELGARALVAEAQRPSYLLPEPPLPPPPPKKRSVREWLLG